MRVDQEARKALDQRECKLRMSLIDESLPTNQALSDMIACRRERILVEGMDV